jgi:hypothetical protein
MLGRSSIESKPPPSPRQKPSNLPSAIVDARYDAKGRKAPWVYAYIRPAVDSPDQFTFDTSEGDLKQGDAESVAIEFIKFDRAMSARGYTRMGWGNLSGDRRFDLFA